MNTNLLPPLYVTGVSASGAVLVGGVFKLKDQCGFPLDMAFEICRERGMFIDYCELLSDAWLSGCAQFDAVVRELDLLGGSHLEEWKEAGAKWLSRNPAALGTDNPIDEFCKWAMATKIGAS